MIKTEDGKQLWEPKEKTAYLCNMWKEIWEKKHECTIQIQVWSRILEGMCKNEERELITASDIMQAAKLLRGSIGIDWWEVEHLKSMTEEVAQAFADILNQVEEKVAWPVQTLLSLIVLMGKPNGGVKPIALMPMLYRLWSKVRRVDIHVWDEDHTGFWDAAIRGSSALRAAVVGAL